MPGFKAVVRLVEGDQSLDLGTSEEGCISSSRLPT
jgi:hypothetical protein